MSNAVAEDHAKCDTFIAAVFKQPQNQKPCCVKGCSACCSEPIYASNAEVDYILEAMTPEQKAEVSAKVAAWMDKVTPILPQNMPDAVQYRQLDAPCPLLKNKLCSVYERRPFGCRTWLAIGNAKDCNLPTRSHQKFAIMPREMFHFLGKPATVGGFLVLDHLGVLLAERLLGVKIQSASLRANYMP